VAALLHTRGRKAVLRDAGAAGAARSHKMKRMIDRAYAADSGLGPCRHSDAQAELASDLSEAFDDTMHSHSDKIEKLAAMDFGPKNKVEEGAVVKLGGRFFVIAVSTGKFVCDGNEIMGISTQAPIYAELEGKRAGDAISFNGRELVIEEVA
jgi:hypothetical protein